MLMFHQRIVSLFCKKIPVEVRAQEGVVTKEKEGVRPLKVEIPPYDWLLKLYV